jgi:two-component system nitrogen regulation sensor histidine kinase NtrY
MPTRSAPEPEKRQRKTPIVLLAVAITILFAAISSQQAFDLTFLRPDSNEQTLIFAALSALIFLLLVALTFVLVRNLLKLFAERRGGVLGSKFRTRMVLGALALSFTPVIFLFLFAYGLMNRSIDKWFSQPIEEVRQDTARVAEMLSSYAAENARAEAAAMAASEGAQRAFQTGNFAHLMEEFRRHQATLQGGFAVALVPDGDQDHARAQFNAPEHWATLREKLPAEARRGDAAPLLPLGEREYMVGSAPVGEHGRILVAMPLPPQFSATLDQIEASQRRYFELSQERKLVRNTYMGLLLLLTVLVLFAATWFALFLSKLVTRPVSALAEATQEISRGRLDYRIEMHAADELGQLVASFNRMAAELEASRQQIEASSREVAQANVELEQRRRHMETILLSIPTGVLSLDAAGRVTHANPAMVRMLDGSEDEGKGESKGEGKDQGGPGATRLSGATLPELFPAEVTADLEHMLRKADRMGSTTSQMEITVARTSMIAAVTVASLDAAGGASWVGFRPPQPERNGYVLVFEDLSDLLRAQKQAAWREVARRVAHEIKNPLTPIALSAERIRRHLERGTAPDEASLAIIHGCAATIGGAVETVRALVDEFSTLARFPAAQPQPADLNPIVERALAMFDGRLEGITVNQRLAPDLPPVLADPEALKRALANLVDNAAEALQDSPLREVLISTALVAGRDAVEVTVADTGHGVTPEVKEKLFLPYFSTKRRGTGLGLAIVSRIVEDHHGSIRVEKNYPAGTRFIVELPVAEGQPLVAPPAAAGREGHG